MTHETPRYDKPDLTVEGVKASMKDARQPWETPHWIERAYARAVDRAGMVGTPYLGLDVGATYPELADDERDFLDAFASEVAKHVGRACEADIQEIWRTAYNAGRAHEAGLLP
jgi:hypothetical protein